MTGKRRWLLVALVLAGATCLAIGVGAAKWWTLGDIIEVRPTGTQTCFGGDSCTTGDLSWLGGGELWRRAGIATWAAGMITALAMVALGGALAARRRGTTLAGVTLVSSMTALVVGLVFVVRYPSSKWANAVGEGLPSPGSHFGLGPLLYLLGILAAAAAAIIALRAKPSPSA